MGTVRADDGATIAFTESGAGPPLVLVHGITENLHAWDPLVPALAERWRVVAVDLRGHGESERKPPYDPVTMAVDVHAVVRDLDLGLPLMVGHSLGGIVVTAYGGARFPARGIVNIDQPIALGGFKEALEPIVPMLTGSPEEFQTAIELVFSVLDGPIPDAERDRLRALAHPEQAVVLGVWSTVLEQSPEELDLLTAALAQEISVPYLSLHGTDPGDDYADWLRATVPDATVDVWAERGHYPQLVEPARFVNRLVAFDASL